MMREISSEFDEVEDGRKFGYDLFHFGKSEIDQQWPTSVLEGLTIINEVIHIYRMII